jgi:hypothetical protein
MAFLMHFLAHTGIDLVTVLRSADGDCSCGGITTKHAHLILVAETTEEDASKIPSDARACLERHVKNTPGACIVVMRKPCGKLYPTVYPLAAWLEGKWLMAGGNFVTSCDSRFRERYPLALPVHDRIEN